MTAPETIESAHGTLHHALGCLELATTPRPRAPTPPGADVLRALSAALAARDPSASCHSARTALIAGMLCEQLRLSRQITAIVSAAAILHDIGKIGIPDAILQKPGPLTPDEFTMVKTHPIIGWSICSRLCGLQEAALAIRHHHEQLDGSGYPDGLRGTAIPLTATIIAVADAYDAMTGTRLYRPARSHDEALAELHRNAGAQFDPDVVTALLHLPPPVSPSGLSAPILIAPSPTAR